MNRAAVGEAVTQENPVQTALHAAIEDFKVFKAGQGRDQECRFDRLEAAVPGNVVAIGVEIGQLGIGKEYNKDFAALSNVTRLGTDRAGYRDILPVTEIS